MSKWICKCNAINPVLNWVCHNCGKDWVIESKLLVSNTSQKEEKINTSEKRVVTDDISDTERLDWLLKNNATVIVGNSRQAIDLMIRGEK